MAVELNGKKLANKINKITKHEILRLDYTPHLVAIKIGNNLESELYLKHKEKIAKQVGIKFTLLTFANNVKVSEVLIKIEEINNENDIDGIMVQLPLPKHIDPNVIANSIDPKKDVEGFHPLNKGLLDIGKAKLIPPTAQGVIELINEYNIDVKSKLVTIVGLGEIAGKPLSKLFINMYATVIMCNNQTKDIPCFTRQADIVVSAVGCKNLINKEGIKSNAVVINIGLVKDENIIYGDIEFETILDRASFVTPITGGTGPMTVALLMRNMLLCGRGKK